MSSLKKTKNNIKPDQANLVTESMLMLVSQCGTATAPWDIAVVLHDDTDAMHVFCSMTNGHVQTPICDQGSDCAIR